MELAPRINLHLPDEANSVLQGSIAHLISERPHRLPLNLRNTIQQQVEGRALKLGLLYD